MNGTAGVARSPAAALMTAVKQYGDKAEADAGADASDFGSTEEPPPYCVPADASACRIAHKQRPVRKRAGSALNATTLVRKAGRAGRNGAKKAATDDAKDLDDGVDSDEDDGRC